MIRKNYTIKDEAGMHMRPATQLANLCQSFACNVILNANAQEFDAKSAMGLLLGNITCNTPVEICFDGPDEAAAQKTVEEAMLGSLLSPMDEDRSVSILAPGIALAPAMVLSSEPASCNVSPSLNAQEERMRFLEARKKVIQDCLQGARRLSSAGSNTQAEILLAHSKLASDPALFDAILQRINCEKLSAPNAVAQAIASLIAQFEKKPNSVLAQRTSDLRDIQRRLTDALCGTESIRQIEADAIIVAQEVLPCDIISRDASKIRGIVTAVGGKTSHAAIIARSLGIPMVLCARETVDAIENGQMIAIVSDDQKLLIDPAAEQVKSIQDRIEVLRQKQEEYLRYADQCPCTRDGRQICIDCNIETAMSADFARKNGARGVGLFRSEYIFMNRTSAPTEEEQYAEYRKVAQAFEGDVVIRTLDVGADKAIPYLKFPEGENPLLGTRGIRYSLANPDLFRVQLRAILRASAHGRVKIMFPFVSTLDELRQGRRLVEQVKKELAKEDLPFDHDIAVGMMVELPSAAVMADSFAREADFFSIGTNDLQQYTFAAERAAETAERIIHPYHPAILRLISSVTTAARRARTEVCICGGLAELPALLPLWIAMGVQRLSVGSATLLQLKQHAQELNLEDSEAWLQDILACDSAEGVEQLLTKI